MYVCMCVCVCVYVSVCVCVCECVCVYGIPRRLEPHLLFYGIPRRLEPLSHGMPRRGNHVYLGHFYITCVSFHANVLRVHVALTVTVSVCLTESARTNSYQKAVPLVIAL